MRHWNRGILTTAIAATTTLGLLLAASAAETKKEKAAKPEEKTAQSAKASNSTQIAAPLTAKLSSKLMVASQADAEDVREVQIDRSQLKIPRPAKRRRPPPC